MQTRSLYVEADDEILRPLTDAACADAPQAGVHLYHFPLSLCSQKARLVLEEKRVAWTSHVIQLPVDAQYDPAYVRINPRCVVPTLVRDGRVTTDSENILRYVDARFDGPRLVPIDAGERECMDRFVRLADALFMEVLTYAEIPGARKPLLLRRAAKDSHANKLARLEALARAHADEPALRAAYEAKRALVERTVRSMAAEDNVAEILEATAASIAELDAQLRAGPFARDGWLCSADFSLADIEWAVVLYRLRWVGLAPRLWGQRPEVERYAARLFARPSFEAAVIEWTRPVRKLILPLLAYRIRGR